MLGISFGVRIDTLRHQVGGKTLGFALIGKTTNLSHGVPER